MKKKIDLNVDFLGGEVITVLVPSDGVIDEYPIEFVGNINTTSDNQSVSLTAKTNIPGFVYCYTHKEDNFDEEKFSKNKTTPLELFKRHLKRRKTEDNF